MKGFDVKLRMSATSVILIAVLITIFPTRTVEAASPVRAVVIRRIEGCDYFMVQMRTGYGILEWYGGHDPDKDDTLYGDMRSYGMKSVHDETADSSTRVWVEDYDLTKTDALDNLLDKCE